MDILDYGPQSPRETVQDIIDRLINRIEASGYSVTALASATGIPRTTLVRKVEGETEFTTGEILRLIEALDATASSRRGARPAYRQNPRAATIGASAPRLLKVSEVASHLGVGIDWVYLRIKRGEIPVVELGDTRKNQRVRESDLADFIERNTYGVKRRR